MNHKSICNKRERFLEITIGSNTRGLIINSIRHSYLVVIVVATLYISLPIKVFWDSEYKWLTVFPNWIIVLLVALWISSKISRDNVMKYLVLGIFTLYLFVLYQYVAYINIGWFITTDYIGNHNLSTHISLIPFHTIIEALTAPYFIPSYYIQIIGNLLLLTPLAFSLRFLKVLKNNKETIIAVFFTSLGIEIVQLIQTYFSTGFINSQGRATDIDDLILNTLSGVIGIEVYKLITRFFGSTESEPNILH